MQDRKPKKLYNILFMPFFLSAYSITSFFMIPVNFLVDSMVLLLIAFCFKLEDKWQFYSKSIVKVWLLGFAADLMGTVILSVLYVVGDYYFPATWFCEAVSLPLKRRDLSSPVALAIFVFVIALSGVLIYLFNKKITFRKLDLTNKQKTIFAIILAVCTAPYTLLAPL